MVSWHHNYSSTIYHPITSTIPCPPPRIRNMQGPARIRIAVWNALWKHSISLVVGIFVYKKSSGISPARLSRGYNHTQNIKTAEV